MLGTEQLFHAIDRELFDLVDHFATTIVAFARQAFSVLVGERRTHRFHHGRRHEVLARDQFESVVPGERNFVAR